VCRPDGVITVIFAHQTTKAWTALVTALFEAGLNITATFPINMERKARMRGLNSSALESSITVVCRPRVAIAPGSFKDVRRQIERVVKESVKRFWDYGFRGADLIVACYGPAVGEFGKYERVERGEGTPVTVPELLQLVRETALKAIAGEFTGAPFSRLYFVWANLYGVGRTSLGRRAAGGADGRRGRERDGRGPQPGAVRRGRGEVAAGRLGRPLRPLAAWP
jgi:adenine-specific DNA methylase